MKYSRGWYAILLTRNSIGRWRICYSLDIFAVRLIYLPYQIICLLRLKKLQLRIHHTEWFWTFLLYLFSQIRLVIYSNVSSCIYKATVSFNLHHSLYMELTCRVSAFRPSRPSTWVSVDLSIILLLGTVRLFFWFICVVSPYSIYMTSPLPFSFLCFF